MKAIGKLIGFFFNLGSQYDRENRKYYRRGYFRQVLSVLVLPLLAILAGLCGYSAIWIVKSLNIGSFFFMDGLTGVLFAWLKFFTMFILAYITIALTLNVVSLLIQRTIIAFKAVKAKKKSQEAQGPKEELSEGETRVENIEEVKYKTSRGFDIFYGITCLLILVGIIAVVVSLFYIYVL